MASFNRQEGGGLDIGGKAEHLVWLRDLGFRVPPFITLSTTELKERELCRAKILAFVESCAKDSGFSVRSSAIGEDGGVTSFAGVFESVLNLKGLESIAGAVESVLASANSERARFYRIHTGQTARKIEMGVIVQKMAYGDRSGVLFTANPNTGERGEVIISAAWGCCEGVVSGLSDCDEYKVDDKGIATKRISEKRVGRNVFEANAGVETFDVPLGLRMRQVLTDHEIQELALLGRNVARALGAPADIEWCIDRGQIFLLQCRPISSPSLAKELDAPEAVFDNSNIQESFCGVTLPLTFSFASQAYCKAYSQLMRAVGFSSHQVQEHHERHQNMLSYVRGRIYYNINNWYEGLKLLPSFKRNKEDMERMMGVERPVDFVKSESLSWSQRIGLMPRLTRTLINMLFNFAIIDRKYRRFTSNFDERYNALRARGFHDLNSSGLHKLLKNVSAEFLELWDAPLYNDFFVMTYNGKVTRAMKRAGVLNRLGDLLLVEGLESTAPTKRLVEIGEAISSDKAAREMFDRHKGESLWRELRRIAPDIHSKCLQYVEEYGDRVAGELKLETLTMRDDPTLMEELLRGYLSNQNMNLSELIHREQRLRGDAEDEVYGKVRKARGALGLFKFKNDLAKLRKGILYRESMRLRRTRLFGLVRSIYRELAQRWMAADILSNVDDIFYLTESEIDDFFSGRSVHSSFRGLVELRRQEFQEYEATDLPSQIRAHVPIYNKDLTEKIAIEPTGDLLRGLGCCPGQVTGEVEVRRTPTDPSSLQGKILCALRTDPGWAPAFYFIKGLIVEKGSSLSHSAIIARELGIPAVVGVPNVTRSVQNGDWVTLDGGAGTVSLLKNERREVHGSENTAHL